MISLKHVDRSYKTRAGETWVLRSVNLDIRQVEFVTIMGPSGAGKSSLLNVCLIVFLLLPSVAIARDFSANDCEPNLRVEQAFVENDLSNNDMDDVPRQRPIVVALLTKYPDDLRLNLQYQQIAKTGIRAEREAMIEKYRKLAEQNPRSVRFQYLYAKALVDSDTPKAIELMKGLVVSNPTYPWPHLSLAQIYSWGKFADAAQSVPELDFFLHACPASLDPTAEELTQNKGTPEMDARYAANLRPRLREDKGQHVHSWRVLWDLEFKSVPVTQHDSVRRQVAADLQYLEKQVNPPSAQEMWALRSGYTLLGDQKKVDQLDQELVDRFPQDTHAQSVVWERWRKEHPQIKPEDSPEKKIEYYRSELQMADGILKSSPENELYLYERFDALSNLLDSTPEQIEAAADARTNLLKKDQQWSLYDAVEVGKVYVWRHIRVAEVPVLIKEGQERTAQYGTSYSDRETQEVDSEFTEQILSLQLDAANILIDAARELNRPELAASAIAQLANAAPKRAENQSKLLAGKANYAELQGHKLDALLMYRKALEIRPSDAYLGSRDDLAENQQRLWKELGGTEATLELWKRPPSQSEIAKSSPWQTAGKEMTEWKLTDLQGKTWQMSSLRGKTIFINVWASWCGACQEEHPYLQKLYEQIKDRQDVQVVTFDVDEEVGAVEPYMQKHGYTFPVLLASQYVESLPVANGIPRNWIVSSNGQWLWDQRGFDPDEKWPEKIMQKIEESKTK